MQTYFEAPVRGQRFKIIERKSRAVVKSCDSRIWLVWWKYGVGSFLRSFIKTKCSSSKVKKLIFNFHIQVVFEFAHKIDDELAAELEEIGVTISQFPLHSNKNEIDEQQDEMSNLENINKIDKLNLDVTTLLAYVSSLTNGSNFEFADRILAQQSALERSAPVKAMLDKIFEGNTTNHPQSSNQFNFFSCFPFVGKELICCETASKSYDEICATVGGPNEKIRAEEFVKRITVLPDVPIPVELAKLNVSGQIKPRSLLVFSFGIAHKALTVTANKSFIRSAKMQVSPSNGWPFVYSFGQNSKFLFVVCCV